MHQVDGRHRDACRPRRGRRRCLRLGSLRVVDALAHRGSNCVPHPSPPLRHRREVRRC
jgi:hypothetical protein